jgi:FkbM family methyltransferase
MRGSSTVRVRCYTAPAMNRRLAMLPHAAALAVELQQRFRASGLSRLAACRAVVSPAARQALYGSRVEALPAEMRGRVLGLVVDVGANEGQWLTSFLRFVRASRVEVFEPIPACVAQLRTSFGGAPYVSIHQAAVGNQTGTVSLNVTEATTFSSVLAPAPEMAQMYNSRGVTSIHEKITVPLVTLDEALPDTPVDLLKIDVQGFERQVIAGAERTLARTRTVLMEANYQHHYDGDALLPELWQLLAEHGFGLWNISSPCYGPDGRALWADAVFVKE